jgi:hypothetical protein
MELFLLITHIFSLFPISIFLWSWKIRKDLQSVYMLFYFIYCVTFSLFYHSYHIDDIDTVSEHQNIYSLLDSYLSSSLIIVDFFYSVRVRSPQFYILSQFSSLTLLILYLFNLFQLIIYGMILIITFVGIIKWRTIYRYIIKYYFLFFITLLSLFFAFYNYFYQGNYIYYHSLWHLFIFMSSGLGAIMRFKLDQELYPIALREHIDSI